MGSFIWHVFSPLGPYTIHIILKWPSAFIKRHTLLLLIIAAACISAVAFLYAFSMQIASQTTTLEQSRRSESARIHAAIAKIPLKKAAEAKLTAE